MKTFKSTSGQVIVHMGKDNNIPNKIGDLLYSDDGIKFYQTICHGGAGMFGGNDDHAEFSVTFSVPQLGIDRSTLNYTSTNSGEMIIDGAIFRENHKMYVNLKTVIKLPDTRESVYHYIEPESGMQIYVDDYVYYSGHDTIELCLKEKGRAWEKVEITGFTRYRDGGTTIIKTTAGELYLPTPLKPHLKALWNRLTLEEFVR